MSIELSEYSCGGYFIAKYAQKPQKPQDDRCFRLLPDKILSISGFCEFIPESWTWDWAVASKNYKESECIKWAAGWGLDANSLRRVREWLESRRDKEIIWPKTFCSPQAAYGFKNEFLREAKDIVIFGIGLHKSQHVLLYRRGPFSDIPLENLSDYAYLSRKLPLEKGGEILGFELVSFGHGFGDSWFINDLPEYFHKKFNITPNKFGFIDNFEEASRCALSLPTDGSNAEPGRWLPWLIVKYL
jgi:hypothetical protein